MSNRPGVLFRFELLDALEQLDPADAGLLFLGAMHYAKDGTLPTFQSPLLPVVWSFIKTAVDRDAEAYDSKILQKKYAVYVRESKKAGLEPMDFETWKTSSDISRCQPISGDIHNQTHTQYRYHNHSQMQEQEHTQVDSAAAAPPTPARRKYGTYGWVRLTDDEHAHLEHDLGAVELARCIAYVDESAQGNGNKNRWKDWNLVVRRCSREGWGRNRAQMEDKNRLRTESDYSAGSGDFFGGGA